ALRTLIRDASRRAQVSGAMEQVIAETARLLQGTALLRELTPRARDAISSAGERLATPLVAGALCEAGLRSVAIDATELIVNENHHGNAARLLEQTHQSARARLRPFLADGLVPVAKGLICATTDGTLTTPGPGRSDYS